MKSTSLILLGVLFSFLLSCNNVNKNSNETVKPVASFEQDTSIEQGKYLVTLMDCNTCHTPNVMTDKGPRPDMSKMLSGYPSDRPISEFDGAIVGKGILFPHPDLTASMGPWGISFAGNITPAESGIGTWSLEQFSKAMREGKYKGMEASRPILPPMPWMSYATLTDSDLEAIFNYLKSIPAIENIVPNHIPPKTK